MQIADVLAQCDSILRSLDKAMKAFIDEDVRDASDKDTANKSTSGITDFNIRDQCCYSVVMIKGIIEG